MALSALEKSIIKSTTNLLNNVGDFAQLFIDTIRYTFKPSFSFKLLMDQIYKFGVQSFLVAAFTSLFLGMVMALQIAVVLDSVIMGISQFVGAMVGKSMVTELSPLILAFVFAGRVGSSVTAEIGTMKISEQLDALKTLYTNPIEYVAIPRFWAGVIALPMLTIVADVIGIFGGAVVSLLVMNTDPVYYVKNAVDVILLKDFIGSIIKGTVFGAIIMLLSCHFGFKTEGGAEGVGRATTNSVVYSFVFILVSDYILITLFSYF